LHIVFGVVSQVTNDVLYSSTSMFGLNEEMINSALLIYVFDVIPYDTNLDIKPTNFVLF